MCDQAKAVQKIGRLSELELQAIKKQVEDEAQCELCTEQDLTMEPETEETDVGIVEDEMNDMNE